MPPAGDAGAGARASFQHQRRFAALEQVGGGGQADWAGPDHNDGQLRAIHGEILLMPASISPAGRLRVHIDHCLYVGHYIDDRRCVNRQSGTWHLTTRQRFKYNSFYIESIWIGLNMTARLSAAHPPILIKLLAH